MGRGSSPRPPGGGASGAPGTIRGGAPRAAPGAAGGGPGGGVLGLPRIALDLAAAMTRLDLPGLDGAWLVPVPLGQARFRDRGYNQSERLARALGRGWRRPVVELLVRTRDTTAQTALTPEARLANVAGGVPGREGGGGGRNERARLDSRSGEHTAELPSQSKLRCPLLLE